MKSLTLLAFGFVGVLSFAQTKPLLKLQLTNTIPLERKNQSVEIASASVTGLKNKTFIVKNQADQSEIPYQWLSDGKLLIQADFKPNEHKRLSSPKVHHPKLTQKFTVVLFRSVMMTLPGKMIRLLSVCMVNPLRKSPIRMHGEWMHGPSVPTDLFWMNGIS